MESRNVESLHGIARHLYELKQKHNLGALEEELGEEHDNM